MDDFGYYSSHPVLTADRFPLRAAMAITFRALARACNWALPGVGGNPVLSENNWYSRDAELDRCLRGMQFILESPWDAPSIPEELIAALEQRAESVDPEELNFYNPKSAIAGIKLFRDALSKYQDLIRDLAVEGDGASVEMFELRGPALFFYDRLNEVMKSSSDAFACEAHSSMFAHTEWRGEAVRDCETWRQLADALGNKGAFSSSVIGRLCSPDFFGPFLPTGKGHYLSMETKAGDDEVTFEITVPEEASEEEMRGIITEFAQAIDGTHRGMGGHGVRVKGIEILCHARIPEGAPQ